MADDSKKVFISYRRASSEYIARSIFENLDKHGYYVLMDVESIDSGPFDKAIFQYIEQTCHFLLILVPGTLERCLEPNDMLRLEIEHAIDTQRNIVPVRVHNFEFSNYMSYLTGKLSELSRYNGPTLSHEHFTEVMGKLRSRFLKQDACGSVEIAPLDTKRRIDQRAAIVELSIPTQAQLRAEALLAQGSMHFLNGDLDQAIESHNLAIELNPDYVMAYNNRGTARAATGDLDGAIEDYDKAIDLNPDYAIAYNNRGLARHNKGDLDGAIADFDKAIVLDPDYAIAYYNRANARYNKNDVDGAIEDYDKAIDLNPDFAIAYVNRGNARGKQGDLKGAVADFDRAIELDPEYAAAYSNRGEAYFALKRYDRALADFKKSEELSPGYHFARAGMAITQHALGAVEEARRLWQGLVDGDERYLDVDWVKEELNWIEPLVEEARKLIAGLEVGDS